MVIEIVSDITISPKGLTGTSSGLESLLASFERVAITKDSIPILRMSSSEEDEVDYDVTRRFMKQVVAAGEFGVQRLYIAGDPIMEEFYSRARSGFAIEALLNPPVNKDPKAWSVRVEGTEAARSVWWRRHLVDSIAVNYGTDLLWNDPQLQLNIFSIASGVGRGPLDIMSTIDEVYPGRIKGTFVEADGEAVIASSELAKKRGLDKRIKVLHENFFALRHAVFDPAHIVEVTGFTDYFRDTSVSILFKFCRRIVAENGVVVVTNITSSREKAYLDIVWGEMHRRTPSELASFAVAQGFDPQKTTLVLDPTETMCTVVTRP